MDEAVGDVPSEGGSGARRFGPPFRPFAAEPSACRCSAGRLSLLFVVCIVGAVMFAVFFPILEFASRSSKRVLPFPEIAKNSSKKDVLNTNCSSNVLSFGYDCTETSQTLTTKSTVPKLKNEGPSLNTEAKKMENETVPLDEDSEIVAETRSVKIFRTGRSKWPVISTPYPYYLPEPTQGITDRLESDVEEANVIAIPADMNQEIIASNKPRVNFTLPPYAFTPFPNFNDSYAQLLPYKVQTNHTHFEEILKFLNKNEEKLVSTFTEKPLFANRRLTTMKVSGTYRMPLDRRRAGDNQVSSSEKTEEARPFFNGHAYISDPFVRLRPSPIDVNRLVPIRPDIGSRYRRPLPVNPSTPLAEEDTQEPQNRDFQVAAGGTYTEAIFHGAGSVAQPSDVLTPPQQDELAPQQGEGEPLSVTLDIYPVTMEMIVPEPSKGTPPIPQWREKGRFKYKQRPRWRPQAVRRPAMYPHTKPPPPQPPPPQPPPPQPASNHMVVHLNLFPNKRKPYTFQRRNGGISTSPSSDKTTLMEDGQFGGRSLPDNLVTERMSDQNSVTTAPFSTGASRWSTTTGNVPQYTAMARAYLDVGNEEVTSDTTVNTSTSNPKSSVPYEEENCTVVDNNNHNTSNLPEYSDLTTTNHEEGNEEVTTDVIISITNKTVTDYNTE